MERVVEEWRPIKGFPGYEVSNRGRVRSWRNNAGKITKSCRIRKPQKGKDYLHITFSLGQKKYITKTIHRLVAEAFLKKKPGQIWVNHKDADKHNNMANNLEWCTREHNELHAIGLGLKLKGSSHPNSKITEKQAKEIYHAKGTKASIARKYNITASQVYHIKTKKQWAHLWD